MRLLGGSLLLLIVCITFSHGSEIYVKHLAGPPSEFALFTLPEPYEAADVQHSASFKVHLSATTDPSVLGQTVPLVVDSLQEFRVSFYAPFRNLLTLSLVDPKGSLVPLQSSASFFPIGDQHIPGEQGEYTLTVQTVPLDPDTYIQLLSNSLADAYIVMWNEDELAMHTYLNTYSLTTGNEVGLVTRAFDASLSISGVVPNATGETLSAEMSVELPDGTVVNQPMLDDGLCSDGVSQFFATHIAGLYSFTATIRGTLGGVAFVRTTQQVVEVVDPSLALMGAAVGTIDETETRMVIGVFVSAPSDNKYKVFAEVWGNDAHGNKIPVAWIGGMSFVEAGMLEVELDLRWISMANAYEPLELRNVVVQDPATSVPIAQIDEIPLKVIFDLTVSLPMWEQGSSITSEMTEGLRPPQFASVDEADAAIILIHGYCSGTNPWLVYKDDWSNAYFYEDLSKNVRHDAFALNVFNWAKAKNIQAYTVVGHSQGGAVALHMQNYYWTGLDKTKGGRKVQSVGTPYQGCSGAGSAADLGKIFGISCGANTDLTVDGAALWLKGITTQSRAQVYYYTTTYALSQIFGDYCNLAIQLLLKFPNDGTSEHVYAQLPSGQYLGNAERECHTASMKYAPQTQNRTRNSEMNRQAARTIV